MRSSKLLVNFSQIDLNNNWQKHKNSNENVAAFLNKSLETQTHTEFGDSEDHKIYFICFSHNHDGHLGILIDSQLISGAGGE